MLRRLLLPLATGLVRYSVTNRIQEPPMTSSDWYERRDELMPEQVFVMHDGTKVKLDRTVPGDATRWYAATWSDYTKGWSYEDFTVEPGDLSELQATHQTPART